MTICQANIVCPEILRVINASVASKGLFQQGVDVKNAYLHAPMTDEVYVIIPEKYERYNKEHAHPRTAKPTKNYVVRLCEALCGMRQAGRLFYLHLHGIFVRLGFTLCTADQAVSIWRDGKDFCIVVSATDDLTLVSQRLAIIMALIARLREWLELVFLGEQKFLIGLHITNRRFCTATTRELLLYHGTLYSMLARSTLRCAGILSATSRME